MRRDTMIRFGLCLMLMVFGFHSYAEKMTDDYFREDQNIGLIDKTFDEIEGLILRIRSSRGVEVGTGGKVVGWKDQSGKKNNLRVDPRANLAVELVPDAVNGQPAVRIPKSVERQAAGLLTGPIAVNPAKGMTMMMLARVSETPRKGVLMAYGTGVRTPGALLVWLADLRENRKTNTRSSLNTNTGSGKESTLSYPTTDLAGRGVVSYAVRFDPKTKLLTLFLNGVKVGEAIRKEALAGKNAISVGMDAACSSSVECDIFSVAVFNRALSAEELAVVERTSRAEIGLTTEKPISAMAHKLPYAYYPSKNQIEVAIALSPELVKKSGGTPNKVEVRIVGVGNGEIKATGIVPLNAQFRGQEIFDVPDFPDGEYAVEYVIGNHVERSPETFKRIHFPFENERYGIERKVYPPFEPVNVSEKSDSNGTGNDTVTVVGRSYRFNGFGLFDSVESLGRELLARPMVLCGKTTKGPIIWEKPTVSGRVVHDDEAVFECSVKSDALDVKATTVVQEDGCAKVALTLIPAKSGARIETLSLDIPLKDEAAPYFHYVADNGMRFNYAGKTPRGGKIEWYTESWDDSIPIRWRVAKPGSDDGVVWSSNDPRQHGNQQKYDHRPFVPYIWLGGPKRGLAFFMENEKGFELLPEEPVQKVIRKGDQIIIRVEIIQCPTKLTKPRTLVFGLMGSPGKPMEKAFRTREFASGVGPVTCWGGWRCSSKYPSDQDWSVVDKIQDIRRRGEYTKEDREWFEKKYQEVKKKWGDRKVNGTTDWLWLLEVHAKKALNSGRTGSGTYFEEHATDPLLPEWEVFQDEWASQEFNRFRESDANWGVFSPSYHDFVLWVANQWMKRGVSLYFDNTNPKRCYNERFGPAYRGPDGALRYGLSIFGQRDYYRRIYKLLQQWNVKGAEYPIDFTLHITNTQTIPFNTWATATLDLEQRAQTENPDEVPLETELSQHEFTLKKNQVMNEKMEKQLQARKRKAKKKKGYQLPWAPEYTQTVSNGRHSGVIPLVLNYVSGHGRNQANDYTSEMLLRDWAMRRIHDIRNRPRGKKAGLAADYDAILNALGYGDLDTVEEFNYWDENAPIKVYDDRVKWMALKKRDAQLDPFGLLILQNYSRPDAITTKVSFPGATSLLDVETRELIQAKNGEATVSMPGNLSTRMFLVARDSATLARLAQPKSKRTEDFALAVPIGYEIVLRELVKSKDGRNREVDHQPVYYDCENEPGKRFLRMPSGMRSCDLVFRDDRNVLSEDYDLSFRVRLPKETHKTSFAKSREGDVLLLRLRDVEQDKKNKIKLRNVTASIRVEKRKDGNLEWSLVKPTFRKEKQRTLLTCLKPADHNPKDPIPLTTTTFGEWLNLTFSLRGKNLTVLVDGEEKAKFALPTTWSGKFILSGGDLLKGGRVSALDIADVTIRNL